MLNWIKTILYKIVSYFFRLMHKELTDEIFESFFQFFKFCIVGLSNTILAYFLNVGTLFALKPIHYAYDYIIANMVGFLLSVLWSFYWNNKFVFIAEEGKKRTIWKAILKTYASYGFTGIILCNILSFVWIDIFGISKFVAPLLNLVVSVPLNFLINKFWAFKTDKRTDENDFTIDQE